jgi:hypothetical protein
VLATAALQFAAGLHFSLRTARDEAARGKDSTVTNAPELAAPHNQLLPAAGQRRSSLLAALAALLFGHFHLNLRISKQRGSRQR